MRQVLFPQMNHRLRGHFAQRIGWKRTCLAKPVGAIFAPAYYPTYRKNRDNRFRRASWAEVTAEPFPALLGDVRLSSRADLTRIFARVIMFLHRSFRRPI
jgi:hypothetical protein